MEFYYALEESSPHEFLAMVNHEIRTSLNNIAGFARLLSEASLHSKEQNCVHTILASAEGMLRILDDILDLSCIEESDFRIESQPFVGHVEDVSVLPELWIENTD